VAEAAAEVEGADAEALALPAPAAAPLLADAPADGDTVKGSDALAALEWVVVKERE
jgi:hypothetical protein